MLGERIVAVDPIGRVARTARGRELAFDALVVATGARPRRLPLEIPKGGYELRTLADARALRERADPGARLVVIGGGFVGAEVASTARSLGVEVTIVEAGPGPARASARRPRSACSSRSAGARTASTSGSAPVSPTFAPTRRVKSSRCSSPTEASCAPTPC